MPGKTAKAISNLCPGSRRTSLAQRAHPDDLFERVIGKDEDGNDVVQGGHHDPERARFIGDCAVCKATALPIVSRESGELDEHEVDWGLGVEA